MVAPSSQSSARSAPVRIDERAGVREEAAYFGPAGAVVGVTYTPLARPATGGVVICSSLHAEFLGNYRKEVLLARELCAHGLAVQRFHYRGEGNSLGAQQDVTFETLCEDVTVAADRLRDRTGIVDLSFLGTRLGALVVAAAAPTGPIVLWEPVLESSRYFREAFRARRMRELKDEVAQPASSGALIEELRSKGSVDVLGYTIHRSLYESLAEQRLSLGHAPRRVLLVQIGKSHELRGEYAVATDGWRQAGLAVDTGVVNEDESWWFVGEDWQPEERREGTAALLDVTRRWLVPELDGATG